MYELHKIRSKSVFERDICQPLLQVHLWATSIIKQYGFGNSVFWCRLGPAMQSSQDFYSQAAGYKYRYT